jgi:hypothetical protein
MFIQYFVGAFYTFKNVIEAVSARQTQAKKRNLQVVNEHFEPVFNDAMATQIVF